MDNSELSAWAKKGYVERDGKLVRASSLVVKKPQKIDAFGQFLGEQAFGCLPIKPNYEPFGLTKPGDTFFLPTGAYVDVLYRFDIVPCPAPRLTRRDAIFLHPDHKDPAKRQRACVTRYFAFKREFMRQAALNGFTLGEVLRVIFILPMPKTWSKAKKAANLNQPHRQKPDADNLFKAAADALGEDDSHIWDFRAIKLWGEKPGIIIF